MTCDDEYVYNYYTREDIQDHWPPELVDRDRKRKGTPVIQEGAVSDLLSHLDAHKSMGPDGIHPRGMRELVEGLSKLLSIICHQSWPTGGVPDDWRLASVTAIQKKGQKEDPGNYRPVSLTVVPSKVMEEITLGVITQHVQDNQGTRSSQHRFRKGRSCLTSLISLYEQVTHLVDEGQAVDVSTWASAKPSTPSPTAFLEKLAAHGLDRWDICWVRNRLDDQAQSS
ncbi:hypothetical protein DUI87_07995 [Hirundo rustica rustica]|uniref:Uncharacterized protein n=1 Tax=Hirundo rustica rustica TaxID=333673 RepID=A0A3M0KSY7_HIRRU|nr:hypothetical protein DUI87_07995 [Hirundo rustica rustica]